MMSNELPSKLRDGKMCMCFYPQPVAVSAADSSSRFTYTSSDLSEAERCMYVSTPEFQITAYACLFILIFLPVYTHSIWVYSLV